MLFIFMLAPEFFIPMRTLTSLFHVAMTGVSAAENIISFIDSPERNSIGDKEFKNEREFKVSNLSFTYPDGTQSLKDINMTFKKGNLTAVVGRELKSNENEIFVDDVDIHNINLEDKVKNILKITHDSHIFSGTVRDNLSMANENLTDKTMVEVLKTVKLWDIFSKAKGLDTVLESQGKNLSGGQAQRVALARALLYDASVYIFDEATSNIDIESEEIILNIIHSLAKEKTVIYISHRLPAIKNADCIYVMDKGRVIESGKHNDLYAKKELYHNMYKHQEELETYLTKRGEINEK